MKTKIDEVDKKKFRVVIYGSARIEKGDPNWNLIYDLAKRIAEEGIDIVTGGGPGLMDAASEGHFVGDINNRSKSIGLQIRLPIEQRDAFNLDIKKEFFRFSERLDNFIMLANAIVVAPGGVGTMLEFFYSWQLIQLKMIKNIPIILLGEMWSDFICWVKKWLLKNKLVEQSDIDLIFLVKNNKEALSIINQAFDRFKKNIL